MLGSMAFDQQAVVFDLAAYAGLAIVVPAAFNPSGYDIVECVIEEVALAAADASRSRIIQRSLNWDVVAGLTSTLTFGAGQGADTLGNGVAALPLGNRGTITAGGAWAALFIATPTDVRILATLQRASGGAQGQR